MFRSWLVRLHRWFGLSAALFLTVAGLTGAVISWDHELDGWLNPALHDAPQCTAPTRSAHDLARAVEARDPQVRVTYLPLATEPGEALVMMVAPRVNPVTGLPYEPGYNQVAVNPCSGEVQAQRQWGEVSLSREHLLPFLYKLHYSLHLPDWRGVELGIWFMGLLAMAWVVDTLVALWISVPNWRQWRKSFAFRWQAGGHKRLFDLHRSGGMWLLGLVLMLAVTSVAMNLRDEVMRPLLASFSTLTPSPQAGREGLGLTGEPPVGPEQAVRLAQVAAQARGVVAPPGAVWWQAESGLWGVGFFAPGGDHGDGGLGNPWLYIDGRDGHLVLASLPGEGSAGDVALQAMFPLHSGRILGVPGRILVSLMGLAVAGLSITGVMIWARKRRAQAARLQLALAR